MGTKGAQQHPAGAAEAESLVADLSGFGEVTAKKMFGGVGIFCESLMFAIVDPAGRAFLRGDEVTAPDFEAAGSPRHQKMPYWQIPASVRDDEAVLVAWAQKAFEVAKAAKAAKK